jgi:probable HAF family extracellular repeat protein
MTHGMSGRSRPILHNDRSIQVGERSSLLTKAAWAVSLLLAPLPVIAGSVQYTITALPDPVGTGLDPVAINNAGQIAGYYQEPQSSNDVAFIWNSVNGLQAIDSSLSSRANAINSSGTVVGFDSNNGSFEWTSQGGLNYFQNFFGTSNSATGINNSGTICGTFYPNTNEAYTYSQTGGFKSLGFLGSGTADVASAINNLGQVAGVALNSAGNVEAALWNPTSGWSDLGNIQSGGTVSGINNATQVVGSMAKAGFNGEVPYEWTASTGLTPLATFQGEGDNAAMGINNSGAIVGYSYFGGSGSDNYNHAAIWMDGQLQDLNSLIDPNSDWILTIANGINDTGQIIGAGYLDGESQGFLLTPVVPEPASGAMVAIGALMLFQRRRRLGG